MTIIALTYNLDALKINPSLRWIKKNNLLISVNKNLTPNSVLSETENRFFYTTSKPIIYQKDINTFKKVPSDYFVEWDSFLKETENCVSSCLIKYLENNETSISISSSRMGRSRMYYGFSDGIMWLSDNPNEISKRLPNKIINSSVAYSILKYGVSPEFLTIYKGIYSVPLASKITTDNKCLEKYIKNQFIPIDHFNPYYKLKFNKGNGNIPKTESLLLSSTSFIAKENPIIALSGGVDSTLINVLVNKHIEEPYPAIFLQSGDNDQELLYAKEAAKNTKADLIVHKMNSSDYIGSLEFQAKNLFEPVGETSPLPFGFLFENNDFSNHTFIDATLADGCYGSTSYNSTPFNKYKSYPNYVLKLNERLASFLKVNKLPFNNKIFPRDSSNVNEYLKLLAIYIGPFANSWTKKNRINEKSLNESWNYLYRLLEETNDQWSKYSLFKMASYAMKTTTAKVHDLPISSNTLTIFPFAWKSFLNDQSNYKWEEKYFEGKIKYPLKKILEKYKTEDFIHRKKVGLNFTFNQWINQKDNKNYILEHLNSSNNNLSRLLFGNNKHTLLIKHFQKNGINSDQHILQLIKSLIMMQRWIDYHQISVGS
jgi:hypothetical protein